MQSPRQTALPSKLCATLDGRGDCAWTKPGPYPVFPLYRSLLAQAMIGKAEKRDTALASSTRNLLDHRVLRRAWTEAPSDGGSACPLEVEPSPARALRQDP